MATFRIRVRVLKTEIRSREFSISSQSLRMLIINLDIVSILEIGGYFFLVLSLEAWECQKFSVSSRCARLSRRNSHFRLEIEKMTLADLWLKLCLWPSSIIANLERTISFMTFLWDILCLSTWLDCRRISSQASFFFMAPAACLHCLQNPRLAGWGWISGKYREEESTKLSHPFPLPSRQIGEFEALMLWTFFCEKLRSLWLRRWFSWS